MSGNAKSISEVRESATSQNGSDEIDAVILWVDGDDAAHKAKRRQFLENKDIHGEAVRETRFRSVGEIDYCVTSILRYAPYIRNIYVITDAQVPPIFKNSDNLPVDWRRKLNLVDHKQLFNGYEKYLPTFNTRSIETLMHRIPGLAENFLAFNDDFVLIRPTTPEDFFLAGKPLYRGHWTKRSYVKVIKRKFGQKIRQMLGIRHVVTPSNWRAQLSAAELAGYRMNYFRMDHTPKPMQKSPLESFFEQHPSLLEKNISYRFREASQFTSPSLSCHLGFKSGAARHEEDLSLLYINPNDISFVDINKALSAAESDPDIKFACFQSLDEASLEKFEIIIKWMDAVIM